MAEYTENSIKFGWLKYDEMMVAIENGKLNAYDVCFCSDTHEEFIISSELIPIPIKSRVRIYSSAESAIEDIKTSTQSYEGEIISVRDGEKFIAYVVNKFNEDWYITPVYSDRMIDYDKIQNTPIKNIDGTVSEPIILAELEDGCYMVKGTFVTPVGTTTSSIVGDYVIVDSTINGKKIKRICSDIIVDYIIDIEGSVTTDQYVTQSYLESKDYATKNYVDVKLEAFKTSMQEFIEEYVRDTVSLLVVHIVNEVLDSRYSTTEDINSLFGK